MGRATNNDDTYIINIPREESKYFAEQVLKQEGKREVIFAKNCK